MIYILEIVLCIQCFQWIQPSISTLHCISKPNFNLILDFKDLMSCRCTRLPPETPTYYSVIPLTQYQQLH